MVMPLQVLPAGIDQVSKTELVPAVAVNELASDCANEKWVPIHSQKNNAHTANRGMRGMLCAVASSTKHRKIVPDIGCCFVITECKKQYYRTNKLKY